MLTLTVYPIIWMILWGAFLVFLALMILRLIFSYADPNPFGTAGRFGFKIRKLTEKWVYPAARLLANFRVDTRLAPLVSIFVALVFTFFASQIIGNLFFVIDGLTTGVATGNPFLPNANPLARSRSGHCKGPETCVTSFVDYLEPCCG